VSQSAPDAVVVGSGPNGLAAAVTLARAGLSVDCYEGADTPGGGCRTAALTLPGFRHDVCAAVHPLVAASPFFRRVDLAGRGVRLLTPDVAFAHPLDGGRAAAVVRSVDDTAETLGTDADAYRRLFGPLARDADRFVPTVLSPLRSAPSHPIAMARFGLPGLRSARHVARRFSGEEARALLAGAAAHAVLPLTAPLSGGFGLLLTTLAHTVGWPVVEGGSAALVGALVDELTAAGGTLRTGCQIENLADLPPARAVLLDVTPRQLVQLADDRLRPRDRRALGAFRYGPGVCKVDWALDGPVPWAADAGRRAATVHVGGTFEEIARSESDVAAGRHPAQPYGIVVQPGVVDPTRAPAGRHTLWGYCHVPPGSTVDMTERLEVQIERFAPGFRDLILARSTSTAADVERYNPNDVGGDINGGAATLGQTVFRPTRRWNPYRTGLPGVYLCSASTPPGGGVHGMCGYAAARVALRDLGAG
jgi:phytoene dehydrogenase-like protein